MKIAGISYKQLSRAALVLVTTLFTSGYANGKSYHVGDTIKARSGAEIYVKGEFSKTMKVIAQVQLFTMECSTGDAFRLGAGVEGDYFLPKWASFHANYNATYFTLQQFNAADLNSGSNKLNGFSLFEAGGRFHIVDKKGRAKHKIVLSSSDSYIGTTKVTTTRYLRAKLPCRKILALRGGIYNSSAPVSTDMNTTNVAAGKEGTVVSKDGTVFADVYFTNAHTTGVYAGLSQIVNMSVRTSNSASDGTFFSSFFKEVFLDAIFAKTTFDPFVTGGKSYAIEPNAKGSFQTADIGWRLGKKMVFTRKTINMGFSFECGQRPGVKGRGSYFGCGWNIAFVK